MLGLITAWVVVNMGRPVWEVVVVDMQAQGLVTAVVVGHLLALLEAAEFLKAETELGVEFDEAELVAALRA